MLSMLCVLVSPLRTLLQQLEPLETILRLLLCSLLQPPPPQCWAQLPLPEQPSECAATSGTLLLSPTELVSTLTSLRALPLIQLLRQPISTILKTMEYPELGQDTDTQASISTTGRTPADHHESPSL